MAREDKQINFRIPADLFEWIERECRRNASSKTSELVRAIRERKERVEREEAKS